MRIRVAVPDRQLDASTLEALLEAVTRAGQRQIQRREAPDLRDALQRGLRWKPESFADGEHFDLPRTAAERGWGDCDDLAPWWAATLRATGEDPRARAVAKKSGPQRWHVQVERGDGRIQDPSVWAGMRSRGSVSGPSLLDLIRRTGIHAPAARPMAKPGDGAMAVVRDNQGQWWCRCDLPWAHAHLASIAPGRTPEGALVRSVSGALLASDGVSPAHAEYADALAADLIARPGRGVVGSLFDSVLDIAKGPLGGAAASLIPGGGIAHSMLSSMLPGGKKAGPGAPPGGGGGGGGPPGGGGGGGRAPGLGSMRGASLPGGGHIAWSPHTLGPIIVRF